MLRKKDVSYDVMVRVNGRWQIETVKTTEKAARDHAQALMGTGPHDAVKVVMEEAGRREKVVFEEECDAVGEKPISISTVEDAPMCHSVADLYAFESRLCASRLLRKYLDRESLTPLELLYAPGKFKRLGRDDRLINQAVQKIAALQAREFDTDKDARVDFLYSAVSPLSDPKFDEKAVQAVLKELETNGFDGAQKGTANEDILRAAVARYLGKSLEWKGKLQLVLDLTKSVPSSGNNNLLDEVMAEILDGGQAFKEVLNAGDELQSILLISLKLSQGRLSLEKGREHLSSLNDCIKSGCYPETVKVLNRKTSSALGHIQPLTKKDDQADKTALEEIMKTALEEAGFVGGAQFCEALTKRGRITLSSSGDDLSPSEAIGEVLKRLPSHGVKLGYLLDLARSPFAEKYLEEVGSALTSVLGKVATAKDLAPAGSDHDVIAATARNLGARLEGGGFPDAIGKLIAKNLSNVLGGKSDGGVTKAQVKAEAVKKPKSEKEYKQILSRLRLQAGDVIFRQGDAGDEAYLVDSGRIEVFKEGKDGERTLGIIERGEIFGEMALIDQNGRAGTARALEDSLLKIIPAEVFVKRLDRLAENDIVLRRLINVYVKRLRAGAK